MTYTTYQTYKKQYKSTLNVARLFNEHCIDCADNKSKSAWKVISAGNNSKYNKKSDPSIDPDEVNRYFVQAV